MKKQLLSTENFSPLGRAPDECLIISKPMPEADFWLALLRVHLNDKAPCMQSDVTQVAFVYRLWAWFETHRKQAVQGAVAVVAIAFVVSFYLWRQGEKAVNLSQEFASTLYNEPDATTAYMSLATANPNTSVAPKALLVAAGNLFADGKYAEAQTQFEKFAHDYRDNQFISTALLGIAACLDAQGKTEAAISAYQDLITHYPTDVPVLEAKFALARIYESQGKLSQAAQLYEEVVHIGGMGTVGSEASARIQDLRAKLPATKSSSSSGANSHGTSTFDLKTP